MQSSIPCLLAFAGSRVCLPLVAAPSSPQDAYDLDRTCASVTAAESTRQPAATAGADDPTAKLAAFYHQRVQKSGEAAGESPQQITHDVEELKRQIFARIDGPDGAKAQTEKSDTEAMVKNRAALPVFEMEKKLSGRR